MERDNRLTHYFVLFCVILGCGATFEVGYLATSGAKPDVVFLLGDPEFL